MKRSLLVIVCCTFVSTGAQAQTKPEVSVTLAASPAAQLSLGSAATLTATATIQSKLGAALRVPANFRYTFSAQRTSPSSAAITIASNVSAKSVNWTPHDPGVYELSVRATYVESRLAVPDLHGAPYGTATLSNYKVITTGADLIPVIGPFTGECSYQNQDCSTCPYVTVPIYVKNIGNETSASQITVLVKYQGQVIQTWTTTAPAWGTQVKIGSYTTFPWNCPPVTGQYSPNYSVTVDTTNAVAESNEQNNVAAFYLRYPDKTTFKGN